MHRQLCYTITFRDEEEIIKNKLLNSTSIQQLLKVEAIQYSGFKTPTQHNNSQHSDLYLSRRSQLKLEKQKNEIAFRSPQSLKNSIATNYSLKKPSIEWDKENNQQNILKYNQGPKSNNISKPHDFYQRLQKDVVRRQGKMKVQNTRTLHTLEDLQERMSSQFKL